MTVRPCVGRTLPAKSHRPHDVPAHHQPKRHASLGSAHQPCTARRRLDEALAGGRRRRASRRRTGVERKPIYLRLEGPRHFAVHLRRHPDVALAPVAQAPKLLHLGMVLNCRVTQRQPSRVEHANVAPQPLLELWPGSAPGLRFTLAPGRVSKAFDAANLPWMDPIGGAAARAEAAVASEPRASPRKSCLSTHEEASSCLPPLLNDLPPDCMVGAAKGGQRGGRGRALLPQGCERIRTQACGCTASRQTRTQRSAASGRTAEQNSAGTSAHVAPTKEAELPGLGGRGGAACFQIHLKDSGRREP
jgi:hypothetical protein